MKCYLLSYKTGKGVCHQLSADASVVILMYRRIQLELYLFHQYLHLHESTSNIIIIIIMITTTTSTIIIIRSDLSFSDSLSLCRDL